MDSHVFGVAERHRATQRRPMIERAIAAVIAVTVGLSAWLWWGGLVEPHETVKLTVLLLGMATALILSSAWFIRDAHAPRSLPVSLLILAALLLVTTTVSALGAPAPLVAVLGVGGSITGSALVTVLSIAALCMGAQGRVAGWLPSRSIIYLATIAAMVLSGVQRLGWIDLSPGGPAARLFSPLGNELMVGWAVLLVVLGIFAKRERTRLDWGMGALGLGWLTWLDQGEYWVVMLLGLAVTAVLRYRHREQESGRARVVALAAVAMLAVVGLVGTVPQPAGHPVLARLGVQESARVTSEAWNASLLFGAGQGSWSSLYERVRSPEANRGPFFALRYDVGMNWWYTVAAQEGLMGLVVRGALVLLLLIQAFRLANTDEDRVVDAVLACAVVGLLFMSHPYTWLLVLSWLILGRAAAQTFSWPAGSRRGVGAAFGVIGIVMIIALVGQLQRMIADGRASRALVATSTETRLQLMQSAQRGASWVPEYAFLLSQAYIQRIAEQLADPAAASAEVQTLLAEAVNLAKQATGQWPELADAWMMQGATYQAIASVTRGADQFAIQAYQEAIRLAPQRPDAPLAIAQVYRYRADATTPPSAISSTKEGFEAYRIEQQRLATQWLQRAYEKKSDDPGILYAYATNLLQMGEANVALPLLQQLVVAEPDRVDLGLEYATALALTKRYDEAIPYAQRIGSGDPLYATSRRLLTDWYVAKQDWVNALVAWKSLPADLQTSTAFRTRLRELQSKAGTAGRR